MLPTVRPLEQPWGVTSLQSRAVSSRKVQEACANVSNRASVCTTLWRGLGMVHAVSSRKVQEVCANVSNGSPFGATLGRDLASEWRFLQPQSP